MTSVQIEANLMIVQSSSNAIYRFDITKVKFISDINYTIMSGMLKVNETWLSKNHLHITVKMHASMTGWCTCNLFTSVIKCNYNQKPLPLANNSRII